jgi:dienelactone hydrolase
MAMARALLALCLVAAGLTLGSLGLATAAAPGSALDASLDPTLIPPVTMQQALLMLPGDPARPVQLEVTLLKPEGAGPFPLAVLNHGAAQHGQTPRDVPRYVYTFSAYYFLSRGYAVAMPMMRGFAASGGKLPNTGCDVVGLGYADARDIAAVIADLRQEPDLDTSRIVVGGQSFGGWNTLALGAMRPKRVVGLVNFVGGVRSSGCDGGNLAAGDRALVAGMSAFGARTRIPSIWFYGDNDSIFPVPVWQAMDRAYTKAGGPAALVPFGRFMSDSHQLLSFGEGLPLWTGKVDAFLRGIGMPSRVVEPGYLPVPIPPPSHFAAIDDAVAVPNLNARGRQAYEVFLGHKPPRAFALSPDGQSVGSYGGFDPLGRALGLCRANGFTCMPYAVDNAVVWVPPPPPVPSHFAALDDVAAVPYLNATAEDGYRRFLAAPVPRAFVIAPDGSWVSAIGPNPAYHALKYCRLHHLDCGVYAVDRVVVWRGPGR